MAPRKAKSPQAHKRYKKHPIEMLSDGAAICEAKLRGWGKDRTLDFINERRMSIARGKALDAGATKAEAEQAAEDAKITTWTLARDTRQLFAAMREVQPLTGQLLITEQILRYEEEIVRLNLIEQEAWFAYEASRDGQVDVETTTTEDLPPSAAARRARRAEGDEDGDSDTLSASRGGKTVQRRRKPRLPDAQLLAVALRCSAQRVELGEKIAALAAKHGLATMLPAEIREMHATTADDLEKLYGYALRHLMSGEGTIMGNEAGAQERVRLIGSALNNARQLAGRGRGDNEPGAPIVHQLEFVIREK